MRPITKNKSAFAKEVAAFEICHRQQSHTLKGDPMKNSMAKSDVRDVIKQKAAFHSKYFVIKKRKTESQSVRVAFAFARTKGNAVVRNKFKRRIRELVRNHAKDHVGADLLCIAKSSLANVSQVSWQQERQKIVRWCQNI